MSEKNVGKVSIDCATCCLSCNILSCNFSHLPDTANTKTYHNTPFLPNFDNLDNVQHWSLVIYGRAVRPTSIDDKEVLLFIRGKLYETKKCFASQRLAQEQFFSCHSNVFKSVHLRLRPQGFEVQPGFCHKYCAQRLHNGLQSK